jgi:hypothetical protein
MTCVPLGLSSIVEPDGLFSQAVISLMRAIPFELYVVWSDAAAGEGAARLTSR